MGKGEAVGAEDVDRGGQRLRELRLLIWIHAALGVALAGGVFWFALTAPSTPYAAGLMGVGVPWLLAIAVFRSKAARFTPEERRDFRPLPAVPLRLLKIVQAVSPLLWFTGPGAALLLVANFAAMTVIFVHWMICEGLNVGIDKDYWRGALLTLACGIGWNVVAVIVFAFIALSLSR